LIYILLPAFNEEQGLPKVLTAIRNLRISLPEPLRVVVVDDGSRDKTSEVARAFSENLDLQLFRFEENRGVGEVFKTGLGFVSEDSQDPKMDIVLVLDSDNTQDPALISVMVNRIRSGDDLVIASRFEGEGKMIGCPWYRQILSYGVSFLMRIIVRLPHVKDYSTFYRAYRVRLIQKGFERYGQTLLAGQGFAVAAGLLIKLGNLTRHVSEVPLVLRYDRKAGTSGIKLVKTIRGYLGLIFSYLRSGGFRHG
jgi:dolichol-phosphate mannosyltransferase